MLSVEFTGFCQRTLRNGTPFPLKVYTGIAPTPSSFNTVTVSVDLSLNSPLHFEKEKKMAQEAIEKGFLILWDLDFQLGSINDMDELLPFELACDHFVQVLPLFEEHTVGGIFYKGNNPPLDALTQLLTHFPEGFAPFLLLKNPPLDTPIEHFFIASKGPYPSLPLFGWDHGQSALGFFSDHPHSLLPSQPIPTGVLYSPHIDLKQIAQPYRLLSGEHLTKEWDGMDTLIVDEGALTPQIRRKISGFEAAGGKVINAFHVMYS